MIKFTSIRAKNSLSMIHALCLAPEHRLRALVVQSSYGFKYRKTTDARNVLFPSSQNDKNGNDYENLLRTRFVRVNLR